MIISSEEYSIIDSKDEISSQEYGEFLQTVFNDTYSKIDEFKKISVHIVFKVGNTFGDLNARADENAEPYVEIEKDFYVQYTNFMEQWQIVQTENSMK